MTESAVSQLAAIPAHGRFVILAHQVPAGDKRGDHWDVMFQSPVGLLTWASPPFRDDQVPWEVLALPLHREIYLDYEGPISGNRGCVQRVDRGQFRMQDRQVDRTVIELGGDQFRGRLEAETRAGGSLWWCWKVYGVESK